MNGLLPDVRYALRQLRKSPGFTAIAVLTLALGMGMNTAVFSIVDAVALRLPFPHPEQLVVIQNSYSETDHTSGSLPDFLEWREQSHSFTQLVASFRSSFNLTGVAEPQRIRGSYISRDYFSLLGAQPARGRAFSSAEHSKGGPAVCLVSQEFWRRTLNADPSVVGRSLALDGQGYQVVGVMPANAPDLAGPPATDLWIPLESKPPYEGRGMNFLQVIGRLKPGVTAEKAASEVSVIQDRINTQFPPNKHGIRFFPLTEILLGDVRPLFRILLVAVGLVLLIACANVANLLLARGAGRVREFAVREALGAKRWRLVRQMLIESVLLAAMALVASAIVAWWVTRILLWAWPENQPVPDLALDWRVAIFAALTSVLAVIVAGLAPSLMNSRMHLSAAMKEGGRSTTEGGKQGRLRTIFVVSEVALALVLVIASLLTIRSFYRMLRADPGFNGQNLLTARIALPEPRYSGAAGQRFFVELMDRVKILPGVQSVAATAFVPLGEGGQTGDFQVEGRPQPTEGPFAEEHFVAGDFFRTLQIPLLGGRFFSEADRDGAQKVIVINDYMAKQLWPGQDALGKRIQVLSRANDWSVVVGVVGEIKSNGLNFPPAMQIYMPAAQHAVSDMFLVMRTANDAGSLIPAVKNAVSNLDSQQPVSNIALMDELRWKSMAASRSSTSLLGIFAGVALLLAGMGIYAVMAYSVGQRVHEIGIRMALGAQNLDIQRMVMSMCLPICAWGLGIGLLGAVLVTRLLQNLLFGIAATDLSTFMFSTIVLGAAVALASYVPARRATKVDPMVALRYE